MLSKDRIRVVGVYKAPSGVSQADFEIKFKAMAAAFTASPISQNLIKYERGHIDEPVRAVPLGLAKANATVIVIMEAESHKSLVQISEDPAFRELMAASGEALGVDLGETL
ncbi:hypothetical protein B0H13DRAFT_1908748 [Mycena leptocephala]|nr:hypothetical protein B0H13DRAFT_1908748 [Mycena leptocephala]